jgi:hypothetical protein
MLKNRPRWAVFLSVKDLAIDIYLFWNTKSKTKAARINSIKILMEVFAVVYTASYLNKITIDQKK